MRDFDDILKKPLDVLYNKDHLKGLGLSDELIKTWTDNSDDYYQNLLVYGNEAVLKIYDKMRTINRSKNRTLYSKKLIGNKRDDSVVRSRMKLYQLIKANENYSPEYSNLFVTLTFDPALYKDNDLHDLKFCNTEFRSSMVKLRYLLGYNPQYISVHERQPQSGNIHYHVLFFNLPFIPVDDDYFDKYSDSPVMLSKVTVSFTWRDFWSFGFVDVKKLDLIDNVAGYISKYVSKDFSDSDASLLNKKFYTSSRGLNKPQLLYNYSEICNYVNNAKVLNLDHKTNIYSGVDYKIYKLKLL